MATKKNIVFTTYLYEDESNNRLLVRSSDTKAIIFLKLQSEDRKRKIGVVTKSTKTIRMKRTRTLHMFQRYNAYGFNEYVLRTAKTFDKVWLYDEYEDWKIPVEYILKNGIYLHFNEQGFELQKFLSLNDMEQFRVKKKENRRI